MDIPLLFNPRLGHPILELEFLSVQYTMEEPENHMVFEPAKVNVCLIHVISAT